MGFYNVVNRSLMQNGVSEDISQVVANFDAIAAVLNGQVDNLNLKGSPALAAGEVPVWTGSGFDRSSVTRLLANGNIKFDGYGTSLPGSPYDGQVFTLVDSTTAPTYQWTFRYNAGSVSTFKWEFIGGTRVGNYLGGTAGGTSAGLVEISTALRITIPRSGDYEVSFSFVHQNSLASVLFSVEVAKTSAVTVLHIDQTTQTAANTLATASIVGVRANSLSAGDILTLVYQTPSGTLTLRELSLSLIPIRVS